MEKTTSQKIRLGFFVVTGLFIFILAIYFIGDKQKMFGQTNHLKAVFNNVNGLQLGNNVRYSGVNAGTVRNINMINDTIIEVVMLIDKDIFFHIKKDAVAVIGSDGLVGSMIINIIPGKGSKPAIEPGDEIKTMRRVQTDDLLNTLGVTNKNAANLTADLLKKHQACNAGYKWVLNNNLIGLKAFDFVSKLISSKKYDWANWLYCKIFTKEQLQEILGAVDAERDWTEHRRGSTFYVGEYVEITEQDIPWCDAELGIDVSSLVGKRIYGTGTYDDDWGTEYRDVEVQEKTEEVIPAWTEVIEHPETVKITWSKVK